MFLLKLARKQIYLGSLLEHMAISYNQNSCGECTLYCYDFIGRLEIANGLNEWARLIWNPASELYRVWHTENELKAICTINRWNIEDLTHESPPPTYTLHPHAHLHQLSFPTLFYPLSPTSIQLHTESTRQIYQVCFITLNFISFICTWLCITFTMEWVNL